MNAIEKLKTAIQKNKSMLCVGLDPDPGLMPKGLSIFEFNKDIIDATADLVCAFKPNLAFYEVQGASGIGMLEQTIEHIPEHIPVILDAKHNDIGNTARFYAKAVFETLGVDAVTVNPYLGYDGIEPFLSYKDKLTFVLCLTSNKSAREFEHWGKEPLFKHIASKCAEWNVNGNCGLVAGATHPEELKEIRGIAKELPLLVPGIGKQGGDLETSVKIAASGGSIAVFNASRSVIHASNKANFAESARKEALELKNIILDTAGF